MSTKFTKRGIPLVESQSLQIMQSCSKLNDVMSTYISQGLIKKGYTTLNPSLLSFLGTLECGVNYGSEIARNIGVTRQMVAKTVKELCGLGYLEQKEGTGKQKEIHFTETGEYLMSDARQLLSEVDEIIFKNVDVRKPNLMVNELNSISEAINEKLQT